MVVHFVVFLKKPMLVHLFQEYSSLGSQTNGIVDIKNDSLANLFCYELLLNGKEDGAMIFILTEFL